MKQMRRAGLVLLFASLATMMLVLLAGCDASIYSPPDTTGISGEPADSTSTSASGVATSTPGSTTSSSTTSTTLPATTSSSTTSTTSTSTTTTTAVVTPGTVLYEIDEWSDGTEGWAATGQWKTVRGMLVSDGSAESVAMAPVDLGSQADYAVEAEIQVLDPNDVRCYLEARIINGEGYWGGLQGWWDDMQIGYGSDTISSTDFSINSEWHTYRFEVSGNTMTLYFDGAEVARAMDNRQLEAGTVGIYCSGQINVRAFRVIAL